MGSQYWALSQPLSRGVQIASADVVLVKASLGTPIHGYLTSEFNPVGLVTRKNLRAGELLNSGDLSANLEELTTENIAISMRAIDIPQSTSPGDLVTLYQVFDSRNGEATVAPVRVISGVFIKDISRKSSNFGSDLSITLTADRDAIPTILSATSSGRVVIVTNGN